jgi:ABC-type lipoprotein export system ATPase subunit
MALFQELHRQGSTIILVTHEPEIGVMLKGSYTFATDAW